jgi:tetratricopeptide (TPR) repeat protein
MMGLRHTTLWLGLALGASLGCAAPNAVDQAQSLVRQRRADEAAAVLRARLDTRPDDVAARKLLIRVLAYAGDAAGARAQVTELARALPPNDPSPYIELGHAMELGHRYDEALEAYDRASAVAPVSPEGPREGGIRCAHWGEAEAAAPRLEEAVRRGSNDVETWHTLGLVRWHLGDYDGAKEAYRAAAAADPRSAEGWLGLATVAVAQGDGAAALAAYDQVLARRPRFAAAELGRAWALARLGRKDEAFEAIDRAEDLGAPPGPVAKQRAALQVPPTP